MARLAVRPPLMAGAGPLRGGRGWLVAAAVGWNLVSLRALTLGGPVPERQLDARADGAVRDRAAARRAPAAHAAGSRSSGEGSPQFLHYQSLPAILTGALGLLTGPDAAFRWSLYLLLSLWPVSVYLSARAFGAGRPAAAASAAMAPFLVSATGVGYEQQRLRVDWVTASGRSCGRVDAAARVGLQLAGDPRRARLPPRGPAHRAHRRAALRDRLPGAVGAARLAARRRPAARRPGCGGPRSSSAARCSRRRG